MLAGNLASIGVGGIIALGTSIIWPDDFNFDVTRAIRAPGAETREELEQEQEDVKRHEKGEKGEESHSYAHSVTASQTDVDLDPVALDKAFRFAAWSSVGLVSNPTLSSHTKLLTAWTLTASGPDYSDPAPAVLCTDSVRRAWARGVGRHRYHLDVLLGVYGCTLSALGVP